MASKNDLFSHWYLSHSSQIWRVLKKKFRVEFREWFFSPQACPTEVETVSCTLGQQVHEQLDQIIHNPQQDRDHQLSTEHIAAARRQWLCVIITMTPARRIRFCGAWCLYRWEGEHFKNTACSQTQGLGRDPCKFQGPETEVSLALRCTWLRVEVVLSAVGPPTNCFTHPAFVKGTVVNLH